MSLTTQAINLNDLMVKNLHERTYPSWIFDGDTLTIIDANQSARDFCMYDHHEIIGLKITELWHEEDLTEIIHDLDIHRSERCFYGNLKHKKKNGEIVSMRVRATRYLNPKSYWEVHLL